MATAKPSPKKGKPSLFETADAPSKRKDTLQQSKKFLDDLDDEEESSLSEVDSDDFEDVPPAKRRKTAPSRAHAVQDDDEDEDEMDWEDAIPAASSSAHPTPAASKIEDEIGDISVSMNEDGSYIQPLASAATGKKGPSKRERQIRVQTHCLHVMALMWHNTVRNSWLNDKEVQQILVDGLPDGVQKEIRKWKDVMRNMNGEPVQETEKRSSTKGKGKGKGKQAKSTSKADGRDWSAAAESQAPTDAQACHAFMRLLKVLTAYWRKRFTVTAPGLRKQGYKDLRRLRNEIKAWEKDHNDMSEHGERVQNIDEFKKLAKKCEGSKDVGNQLFVALLRGLGLEVRMVANLQPAGFGWSKAEEADPKKDKKSDDKVEVVDLESEDEVKPSVSKATPSKKKGKQKARQEKPARRSSRGNKADPIALDHSESSLSSPPSEAEQTDDDDVLSVIDVTPSKKKPSKKYDRDIAFPNYWTEVCDPVSYKYYPIDPIVLSTIASNDELLQTFEPRGKKAEKAKQVMCYTIAYSADGTAKDVTIRYLKRHQLPGKTKGVRMPMERVPIYNRKGKVRRYEDYDWFRTLISVYDRPEKKRTPADDLEDQTDLKPFKPEKQEKTVEKESLQGYKQSADFVLKMHLRREEALLLGAQPVKTFTAGKGDKTTEHPVYRRSDVAVCKTVESWHKEGRAIRMGEQPLKYVPMRAVTLVRKREMEDAQRETGEKLKQGLYSEAQTDWIIPPPIRNGVIPKNAFGNMDVYVPTMVPAGAVHLPLKGTAKLCRKLEIDYAEACTGFEFGKQRAVPILTGVVVAEEHEQLVRDAWREQRKEEKRKEDTKRIATALHWWRKMLLGLRVLERMRVEYADAGGKGEEMNPFVRRAEREGRGKQVVTIDDDEDDGDGAGGGGFLLPGEDGKADCPGRNGDGDGGFLVEDEEDDVAGGDFLIEEAGTNMPNGPPKNHAPITPVSLQSVHKTTDGAADSEDEKANGFVAKSTKKANGTLAESIRKVRPPSSSKPSTKEKKKSNGRKKIVLSEDEDTSLSDLSDSLDTDSNESVGNSGESDTDEVPTLPPPRGKARIKTSSPQVIVSPVKTVTPSARFKKTRAAKKSTPVRSPYFDHSVEEEDDDDSDDDVEVVKPRQTTARTRSKK